MIFENLKQKIEITDITFDSIYPKKHQEHSARHFTPVKIAIKIAKLLVDNPTDNILDIGLVLASFVV